MNNLSHLMKAFFSLVLLIAVAASTAFAQNKVDEKGRKQGPWKKTTPDGKVIYEGSFVDDRPEGKFVYYYPDGKVKIISYFSQKGKVARVKLFHESNGKLMAEGKSVEEKRDSTWRFYNEDSLLLSEEPYTLGKKNGVVKTFYPNGKVADETPYKMDVKDGVVKTYFNDGTLKSQQKYVNGLIEGKVYFYFPDGKVSVAGQYVNSLKDGVWTFYKSNGQVERTEAYKRGMLQGEPQIIKVDELEKVKQNSQLQQKDREMEQQLGPR